MPRRSTPHHALEAQRLPYHVHLKERPGGLGQTLNKLHEFCRRTYARDDWFAHGGQFMFRTRQMAERFREACRVVYGVETD